MLLFRTSLFFASLLAFSHALPKNKLQKDFEILNDANIVDSILEFDDIDMIATNEFDYAQIDNNDITVADVIRKIESKEMNIKCATSLGEPGQCVTKNCTTMASFAAPTRCQGELSSALFCCPDQLQDEIRVVPKVQKCGIRPVKPGNLIVGGQETQEHSYPWAAALYRSNGNSMFFVCGGSVINGRYILTAAHCVRRSSGTAAPESMMVKLGVHHLSKSGKFYQVEAVVPHENYSPTYHNDDIALLRLKEPIDIDYETISPICLPEPESQTYKLEGKMATMVGWGTRSEGSMTPSKTLYEVQVPVSDQNKCRSAYQELLGPNRLFNWNNVICAAYKEGGKDTCQGDSGGPMTFPDAQNRYTQAGVVSFGYGCAQKGYPGVYTYVPHYTNWVRSHSKV